MPKRIIFIVFVVSGLSLSGTIFAVSRINAKEANFIISSYEKDIIYDLKDLSYETVGPEGNIIKSGSIINDGNISIDAFDVAKAIVDVGHTTYWYPTDSPSGFYLQENDVVEISLRLNKAVRIKIALTNGNSKETTDKNPTVSLVQHKTGYSKVSITNLSSTAIAVNEGGMR